MKKLSLFLSIICAAVLTTGCINNKAIQTLNDSAKALMEKGDSQGAVCRLESSLELDSTRYETRYNLGVAYISLNNLESAKENLEQVIKMKPDFSDAYYSLGVVHENLAYNILNKIAQIALDNEVQSEESETLLSDEEKEQAINELNEAIKYYNSYVEQSSDKEGVEEVQNQIGNIQKTIEKYKEQNAEAASEE